MQIIHARPPNFEDILRVFPKAAGYNVIFCYGDKIYSPSSKPISESLIKHESVHSERQGRKEDTIIEWWDRYLKDVEFRYHEELLAHRAEYQHMIKGNRHARRIALNLVSHKLALPLYGCMVTIKQAKVDIQAGTEE